MSCHKPTSYVSGWFCLLKGLDAGGTADEDINDSTVTSTEQQQATTEEMTEETEKHQGETEADDDVTTQQRSDEEMDHDDQEEELKDIKQTGEQLSLLRLIV